MFWKNLAIASGSLGSIGIVSGGAIAKTVSAFSWEQYKVNRTNPPKDQLEALSVKGNTYTFSFGNDKSEKLVCPLNSSPALVLEKRRLWIICKLGSYSNTLSVDKYDLKEPKKVTCKAADSSVNSFQCSEEKFSSLRTIKTHKRFGGTAETDWSILVA
ncbi:hypothetical protein MHLP_02495 [Candidatus Mycoplasma haematolamae str. Purdue]|uniref:Uncharacterized protein n=1 Tax=Mycoplasma haematolamae (strain Purdue) TaxID=1212765 RepID=I7CJP3_MYCHA|nr:hypothetical protein [Candidatus Mycoplasma haematolamae]AFO52079.1 hypothetical protein MHLP_02495 [Candidatus Mycoplasma haematolamae str. Purdue]